MRLGGIGDDTWFPVSLTRLKEVLSLRWGALGEIRLEGRLSNSALDQLNLISHQDIR